MDYEPMRNDDMDSDTRKEVGGLKKKISKKENKQNLKVMIQKKVIKSFIKIAIGIFLGIVFIALILGFEIMLDDNDKNSTNPEEDLEAVASQAGGIDMTSEEWQLSKTEIQDFINSYNTTDANLREKMLDRIDDIYNWQNNYGYSAGILITIAFEDEWVTADNLNEFFEKMNGIGSGYKTIQEIVQDYVGDDTASEFANKIETKMLENAKNAGIITNGQEHAMSGDGYPNVYVSKSGKMYRNYKQNIGSYSTQQWCGTSIVKNDGCSLIAVTIIISGYQNREVNPLSIAEQYAIKGSGMNIPGALVGNGIQYSRPFGEDNNKTTQFTSAEKQKIKDHVATGSPAIIKVVPPSQFTDSTHFMVLLDYNSATNEFYLSNPYTGNNSYGKTGWVNAETVLYYCTNFYAIK